MNQCSLLGLRHRCLVCLQGYYDAESENCAEHRGDIRTEFVCAGDRLVLRVVDGDGGGGLTAAEMVKYTVSDDGKNGQI